MRAKSKIRKSRPHETQSGHSTPEFNVPNTLLSAGAIITMILLCCAAGDWVFAAMLKPSAERSPTPLHGAGLVLPAQPRLEGIEMMSAENGTSTPVAPENREQTYGWTDRDKHTVHIPIARAMQLAVEQNWLPSAQPRANSDTGPTSTDSKAPQSGATAR
ncbi:MAG TPA: hypothetical protein VHU84_19485 [Lacipirellulaceae bacterium]|jgi:hypothetical protein|nr:hypothetical protein [Lacipirellulaceae bacterium]